MKKYLIFYLLIIGIFSGLIYFVVDKGSTLVAKNTYSFKKNAIPVNASNPNASTLKTENQNHLIENIKSPLGILLLQIIIILIVSRIFGMLLMKIGQPSVVGEIIGGIFLGPSVMGLFFPAISTFVFPVSSLVNLTFLSQIGLIFFMFIVGMELDLNKIKDKKQNAIAISHASIIFPFFLGVVLSYFIYEKFADSEVSFLAFSLFMGIAMSITAFPVLARIVKERGMTGSTLGVMALTCAAADDVTAWCILAFVIAVVKSGNISSVFYTIALACIYIIAMFKITRPWMNKIFIRKIKDNKLNKTVMSISFFVLLFSSLISELIGIHALFGAFLAGVIIPRSLRAEELLTEKLLDISVILLLPIFFALTGLRTQIGLLNEPNLWWICIVIILTAVGGKLGGSAITARIIGFSLKDSLALGILMNTRGLMELIVLNIGFDLGILSPEIFTIMVLMALVTTFMTGPLLDLLHYKTDRKLIKSNF